MSNKIKITNMSHKSYDRYLGKKKLPESCNFFYKKCNIFCTIEGYKLI